ncbi:MAG TPA: oligosaccharide flippase family protein [Thermoanaerobaculia bacterium]|nr:oligosaccharide flippase family protein [Thermoanaerobaculia bacterium]
MLATPRFPTAQRGARLRELQLPELRPEPGMPHDSKLLVQSAGAATLSQVWRMAVTMGTYMVLRRFIPPEEMGVWSWAEPLFVLIAQIRDLGVPGHVVRMRDRTYGNYLVLQVVWGGLLAGALALGAPLLAEAFAGRDAQTAPVLRWMCLFLFVQGLASVPLTYFEVEQRVVRTIPAELARNVGFAALSLVLAWRGFGVWSVVLAHTASYVIYAVALWLRAAGDIPLRYQSAATAGLVRSSWPLAVMSLLELAVLNLDPLIIGLVLPQAAVARASLAILALFFFSRSVADAVGRSVYPALVAHHHQPERSFELYRLATLFLVSFVVPLSFGAFLNAEAVALVLGGEQWIGAGRYLTVAAFVPFLRPLTMFGREYLMVVHRDRLLILYTLTNLLSLGGLGYWLVRGELRELGMAVAGYFPLGTLLLGWGLRQIAPRSFDRLLVEIGELYLLGLLCFGWIWWVPAERMWLRFGLSAVAAAVCVAIALWRHRAAYRRFLGTEADAALSQ